jgi:transcriptional regulator with XRE-family HTH domain
MARHKHTRATLAKALNLSQSSLSRRLTGQVPFNVVELYGIADVLHIDVCDLLNGKKGQ